MNLQDQTNEAKKFTDKLLKFINTANEKTLSSKDGKGCWVENISINYHPYNAESVEISVKFGSNDSNVNSFVCTSCM